MDSPLKQKVDFTSVLTDPVKCVHSIQEDPGVLDCSPEFRLM